MNQRNPAEQAIIVATNTAFDEKERLYDIQNQKKRVLESAEDAKKKADDEYRFATEAVAKKGEEIRQLREAYRKLTGQDMPPLYR